MDRTLIFGAIGGASLALGLLGTLVFVRLLRDVDTGREQRWKARLLLAASLLTLLNGVIFLLNGWRSDLGTWLWPAFYTALAASLTLMATALWGRRRQSHP